MDFTQNALNELKIFITSDDISFKRIYIIE